MKIEVKVGILAERSDGVRSRFFGSNDFRPRQTDPKNRDLIPKVFVPSVARTRAPRILRERRRVTKKREAATPPLLIFFDARGYFSSTSSPTSISR
jgi:hypothetical protein